MRYEYEGRMSNEYESRYSADLQIAEQLKTFTWILLDKRC